MAAFATPSDAVAAALEVHRVLATEPWPTCVPIKVRTGVHTGEIGIRGDQADERLTIIRCSRVRNAGYGGQTLLSDATRDLVVDRPPVAMTTYRSTWSGPPSSSRTTGRRAARSMGPASDPTTARPANGRGQTSDEERNMAYGVILRFEGVSEDQYWAVNERLGIDRQGNGDYPDGMISHGAGPVGDDGWVVLEVWSSRADQEAFMADRLGAALAAEQIPPPAQVIDADLVNHHLA